MIPGFIPDGRGRQLHRSCSDARRLDATTLSMDRPSISSGVTVGRRRSVTFLTLCQSQARRRMSCIAFAATRPPAPVGTGPLPELRISFDITAKSSNVAIHAWTVICDKERKSGFAQGGPEGTVSAPASDPKVVSVAAFDPARGQMWRFSSGGGPLPGMTRMLQSRVP